MKVESFEEYVQNYIDFYKGYDSNDKQLVKLVNTTLHCILNKYKKEKEKSNVKN